MLYSMSYFEYFYVHTCPETDKVTLPAEFRGENVLFAYQHRFRWATLTNIYPAIHFLNQDGGKQEPNPWDFRHKAGKTQDRVPQTHHRASKMHRHTHLYTVNQSTEHMQALYTQGRGRNQPPAQSKCAHNVNKYAKYKIYRRSIYKLILYQQTVSS